MKYKILITFTCSIIQHLEASSFFNEAVRIIDSIPLIDGRTLLGRALPYESERIDLENISQNVFSSMKAERICNNMLKNPVKSHGWLSDTYYTPDEFKTAYKELVHFSFLLNPAALRFCRDVLEDGNIYGLQIPGLKPQPERAQLFKEAYNWTLDIKKTPLFLERIRLTCLDAEAEVAAESKKHQVALDKQKKSLDICLEIDAQSKKTEPSTLRHRHTTWNGSNDIPTERERLLAPQTVIVH